MKHVTQLGRKFMASTIAWTLALGQIAPAAYAAPTDISDVPLAVKNQVAPNIVMTLDDSGSMQWEFLPEDAMRSSTWMYPRPDLPYGGSTYQNQVPNFKDNNVHNFYGRSSHNNKMYYNPDVTYRPWSNPDGSLWPNADPRKAYYNPANTSTGYIDLLAQKTQAAVWFSDGNTGNINSTVCDPGCDVNHTFWPITYFKYKGSGSVTSRTSYDLVQITSTTAPDMVFQYKVKNADGTSTTATRTRDQEIQNFANWFQYYRSRILSARAGIGRAFGSLGETPRIGFATINTGSRTIDNVTSPGALHKGVRAFTGTDRTAFFDSLYQVPIGANGTPLREAMDYVGQYFRRTDSRGPWGAIPGTSTTTAQLSCRRNYHLMMTDGYWNNDAAKTAEARANVDNATGPTHTSPKDPITGEVTTWNYSPATPWSDSHSDTLADVAMYYWSRDLRTDMVNNVFTSAGNNAFWQHISVYGVALGVFGTIPQSTIQSAYGAPYPNITWPNPHNSNPAKIDDLAHAAINARGAFFSASDPDELSASLSAALDNIVAIEAAGAAVGITSANVVPGDNSLFSASYVPGISWSGELGSYQVNADTGKPEMTKPLWTAQAQLDKRTPESRIIATYTFAGGKSQGIPFQYASLNSDQQKLLNSPTSPPGPADAADVLQYLRGSREGEAAGKYRTRTHLLGDIVNSQPVVIRPPDARYFDAGYTEFKRNKDVASRVQIVLQGANDGMLHAFDAGKAPVGTTPGVPGTGKELWAYVSSLVIPTLNNLTRRVGYSHKYYVDATPVTGDVDFNKTTGASGSPDWRTIVVGGLGKGGRGYYALDLTDTAPANEATLAAKVLWEFPNSSTPDDIRRNIGFSFGKPIITKTKANGWVVLVASGYNNGADTAGDGKGYLFVLNARTGELIKAISTGVGSSDTPSGLAHIAGYAESVETDNTVQYVYGGDVRGNVWRFNLTDPKTNAGWSVQKLATLVDPLNNFQPVTTEPELAKIKANGVDRRMVMVGTGMLLGDQDIPGTAGANSWSTQRQTMYGLIDDLSIPSGTNAVIQPLRASLQEQVFNTIGDAAGARNATQRSVDYATKKGWYIDLPAIGERLNTAPTLGAGALVFTSNIPTPDLCTLGGSSYINILDYRTGGYLAVSQSPSSTPFAKSMASAPVLVKLRTGGIVGLTQRGCVKCVEETPVLPKPTAGTTKRKSWRELLL